VTSGEKEVLGVANLDEAITLRDAVMKIAGVLEEHTRTEEAWQSRIEGALAEMPEMMDNKIDAHEQRNQEKVQKALDFVDMEKAKDVVTSGYGKIIAAVIGSAAAMTTIIVALIESTHK
jgi:seryl-tRNA synthetase